MNRDYPLASTIFGDKVEKVKRLQKKEDKLASRSKKAVDEGNYKKADRVLKRASNVEDKKIKTFEKISGREYEPRVRKRDMRS
jgi:hypothetical protein